MKIQSPDDLFRIYDFEEDCKLHIIQYFNANKDILSQINAICLRAKVSRVDSKNIHTNYFLLKQGKINTIYRVENTKIFFIDIKVNG